MSERVAAWTGDERPRCITIMIITLLACLVAQGADEKLRSEDGTAIAATYYGPAKPKKDMPAAILVPMYLGRRGAWKAFAEKAAKGGVACLAIDPRGHGDSENPTGKKVEEWGAEWLDVSKDIAAAKAALLARGFEEKRIVLVGASIGASLSLEYAVKDEKLAGLGLLSVSTNLTGQSPEADIGRYGKRPLFIAYSKDDAEFADTSVRMAKAAGAKSVRAYARAGHGTDMFGREDKPGELTDALAAWIRDTAK